MMLCCKCDFEEATEFVSPTGHPLRDRGYCKACLERAIREVPGSSNRYSHGKLPAQCQVSYHEQARKAKRFEQEIARSQRRG